MSACEREALNGDRAAVAGINATDGVRGTALPPVRRVRVRLARDHRVLRAARADYAIARIAVGRRHAAVGLKAAIRGDARRIRAGRHIDDGHVIDAVRHRVERLLDARVGIGRRARPRVRAAVLRRRVHVEDMRCLIDRKRHHAPVLGHEWHPLVRVGEQEAVRQGAVLREIAEERFLADCRERRGVVALQVVAHGPYVRVERLREVLRALRTVHGNPARLLSQRDAGDRRHRRLHRARMDLAVHGRHRIAVAVLPAVFLRQHLQQRGRAEVEGGRVGHRRVRERRGPHETEIVHRDAGRHAVAVGEHARRRRVRAGHVHRSV